MRLIPVIVLLVLIDLSVRCQVGDLIWEDNFDGPELDLTKWSYETGTGVNGDWGTGQLDRATDRVENVHFEDGIEGSDGSCLVITTRDEFYIDRNYTSGRINTAGKASWGPGHRIVARIFPRDVNYMGQGFAFWMMPDELPAGWNYIMWPQGGEIDIMEYVGSIPYHNLGTVHYAWFWENNQWQSWNHGQQGAYYSYEEQEVPVPPEPGYGGYPPEPDDPTAGSNGFHTYGIDWYSNRMEFFVDGHVYHVHYLNDGGAYQVDGQDEFNIQELSGKRVGVSEYSNHFDEWYPFEHKLYAILSAGVGGSTYTYGGPIVPEATFPCSVMIDWMRVYQLVDNSAIPDVIGYPDLEIYPNPVNDRLKIHTGSPGKHHVQIHDLLGHKRIETTIFDGEEIDISTLEKAVYQISISNGSDTGITKIVKQ